MELFGGEGTIESRLYLDFDGDSEIILKDLLSDNYYVLNDKDTEYIINWCFHKHKGSNLYTYERIDYDFDYLITLWDKDKEED